MAFIPSAVARAVAEKYLQNIYKQELKNYKQEYNYKVALNQAIFKVLTASIAQVKLAMEEIYQAQLAAIKNIRVRVYTIYRSVFKGIYHKEQTG